MPAIKDTLGWGYYRKGSYKAAIAALSDCVGKDPLNFAYQYHLGMAYFKNGDNAKAKASLNEALRLKPSFPGSDEAKQAISKL